MSDLIVKPQDYGIEESKAVELLGNLPAIKAEREAYEQKYAEVIVMDLENPETAKEARELRLRYQKNRTQGIEKWHKSAKELFLRAGQFVDSIKRIEVEVNQSRESKLEEIEKYAENKERERKQALKESRLAEIQPYTEFVPLSVDFAEISDDDFKNLFTGAKMQFEKKQADEAEAERIRLEEEEKARIKKERKEAQMNELRIYWATLPEKYANVDLSELSDDDYKELFDAAVKAKNEHDEKQRKLHEENERLRKQAEADKKAAEEAQRKIDEAKAEAKRIADEAAEKERQRLAEEKRIADEKAKQEAEAEKERIKIAKAPIKKQINLWIESFQLPEINLENQAVSDIKEKFAAFKEWAKKETEKL